MAITKTTKLYKCEVFPAKNSEAHGLSNDAHSFILVHYLDCLDDPSDNDLPVEINRVKVIKRLSEEEGVEAGTVTNYSSENAEVVSICNAIWTSTLPAPVADEPEPEPEVESEEEGSP